MPYIEDDDFVRRYEAAIIHYETTYDEIVDLLLRRFPRLSRDDLGPWTLTDATALGGGFRCVKNTLYWLYQGGLAIRIDGFVLQRGDLAPDDLRDDRRRFDELLRRWKTNRY